MAFYYNLDFALVAGTLPLEAIEFDLTEYPLVQKWYATFKKEYLDLWEIANDGLKEIAAFEKIHQTFLQ